MSPAKKLSTLLLKVLGPAQVDSRPADQPPSVQEGTPPPAPKP